MNSLSVYKCFINLFSAKSADIKQMLQAIKPCKCLARQATHFFFGPISLPLIKCYPAQLDYDKVFLSGAAKN